MADIAKHFSLTVNDLTTFSIVGLLVGGSNVYSDAIASAPRDWDGLIVVSRRSDIGNLVMATSALNRILGIVDEEYPHLPVSTSLHYTYDAVRYCGISESGLKRSVKILSLEHLSALLQLHQPSAIRILSRKNIRVYEAAQYGRRSWCLQPAVTLDSHTYLLHDADIYIAPLHMNGFQYAAFGATVDLLITGKWLYETPATTRLSTELIDKLTKVPNLRLPKDWTTFFARGDRFSRRFRESMRSQHWAALLNNIATADMLQQDILDHKQFLRTPQIGHRFLGNLEANPANVCHRDVYSTAASITACGSIVLAATQHARDLYISTGSQFSSNSKTGTIFCGSQKLFWKIPSIMNREIAGAYLSAPYGAIHLPLSLDVQNGILLYPFFDGRSMAEIRLDHLRGGHDHVRDIIEVEMRRSEDVLAAYCGTACVGFSDSSIQQFFCSRLVNGSRLHEFYHAGLSINQIGCSLVDFLELPIIINGTSFPPLQKIIDSAISILQLADATTIITGMGDGHSGNVMISRSRPLRMIYVDYETAGQHSPWLDLAKPLYNDVFFEALYADLLGRDFRAQGLFEASLSSAGINIAVGDLHLDSTARLLWEIKRRLVLEPFEAYLLCNDLLISNSVQILGNALFCCALFTRNFNDHPDVFLLNLALGVLLSQSPVSQVVDLICPEEND
ncbi:hypothetical protein FB451DRAFT_1470741 [Mycena latifolia]|nr:hypothetical protein FB451DRAFT_1470741 [Mycena latifolia]